MSKKQKPITVHRKRMRTKSSDVLLFGSKPDDRRLRPGESVSDVQVRMSVGKHIGDGRTFGIVRHINFGLWNLPGPDTRRVLAAILLNAWQAATETKSTGQSIAELSQLAVDNGWVAAADLTAHLKKSNKGGRPRGAVGEDTRKFSEMFKELRSSEKTTDSDELIIKRIARQTLPKNSTLGRIHREENKITRALQRVHLLPKSRRKINGK